jgi:hypothetical protein
MKKTKKNSYQLPGTPPKKVFKSAKNGSKLVFTGAFLRK